MPGWRKPRWEGAQGPDKATAKRAPGRTPPPEPAPKPVTLDQLDDQQRQIINAVTGMLSESGFPRSAKEICGALRDIFPHQTILDTLEYMARRGIVAVDSGATGRRFSAKRSGGTDVG